MIIDPSRARVYRVDFQSFTNILKKNNLKKVCVLQKLFVLIVCSQTGKQTSPKR